MKLKRSISHLMIVIAATFGLMAFAGTASAGNSGHHGKHYKKHYNNHNRGHHYRSNHHYKRSYGHHRNYGHLGNYGYYGHGGHGPNVSIDLGWLFGGHHGRH